MSIIDQLNYIFSIILIFTTAFPKYMKHMCATLRRMLGSVYLN